MRIAVIDPVASVPYYDFCLCRALKANGCDVELITCEFRADPGFDYSGIDRTLLFFPLASRIKRTSNTSWHYPLYRVLKGLEYIKDAARLVKYVKSKAFDVIHLQWAEMPLVDLLWLGVARALGVRTVYTVHNVLPHEEKATDRHLLRILYGMCDRLVVHSSFDRDLLVAQFGVPSQKVAVVPHGELGLYATTGMPTKAQARTQLGLGEDERIALFFGVIRPYKGLEVLLPAWDEIAPRDPRRRLVLAGKRLIRSSGLEADHRQVLFADRFIPFGEVKTYFAASDVVVLPYIKTYNSGVLHLAYALGRPVIATATGGLPEVVEHGRSGLLVEPSSVESLGEALESALSDVTRLEAMGRYARQLSDARFSWDDIARRTIAVYQQVGAPRT